MADRVKEHIETLAETIFRNRLEQGFSQLASLLANHVTDHSSRNVLQSGMFKAGVGRIHGQHLQRVLEQTLEALQLDFRQAGRHDGIFFWDMVNDKLTLLATNAANTFRNQSLDYCKRHGGLSQSDEIVVGQSFGQYANTTGFVHARVQELKVRSQFIIMKSPADRKANQIPDVAVMMWFPSEKDGKEALAKAQEKYEVIKAAVHEASNGLATVDKIDNPKLVHKDRISPSVENWLEKAVLVICDLEGNRSNVFYEFGYARAIGTDVIATRPLGQNTDFHLAQWTLDEYTDLNELKAKITPRIATVLSRFDLSGSL